MTREESAGDALFRDPPPSGFTRRVFRLAPGAEVEVAQSSLPDAIVLVEQGELELECREGASRRFGRGSMLPFARLPLARLRNVAQEPLVLVAVSRLQPTDEFSRDAGSYGDD